MATEKLFIATETDFSALARAAVRDELKSFFSEFINIQPTASTANLDKEKDEEFDMQGLSNYLKCSIVTIHNLKKEGLIPYYRLGRKVYFKKSEIDNAARVSRFLDKVIA